VLRKRADVAALGFGRLDADPLLVSDEPLDGQDREAKGAATTPMRTINPATVARAHALRALHQTPPAAKSTG